jgi:type IV secretory pathway protease TraF
MQPWFPEWLNPKEAQSPADCCKGFRRAFWGLAGAVLAVAAFHWQPYRIVFNHTPSAPLGFYLLDKAASVPSAAGPMVGYRYVAPDWALKYQRTIPDGSLFLKVVGAVPGEYLQSEGDKVYACPDSVRDESCRLLSVRQRVDKQGAPLPIADYAMTRIPAGMYWLASGKVEERWAFDSRYLGLIPGVRFTGGVSPIFTWQ